MDASAINAMMNMATVQGLSSQNGGDPGNTSGSGSDFSAMLSSMLGTSGSTGSALAGLDTGGTSAVDYSALLGGAAGGLRVQDTQTSTMLQMLQDLMGAESPAVTDPVLAQLLQMLQGMSGGQDGENGDLTALMEQLQARLREILDEDGAAMAGQEAMALMTQLVPLFTDAATATAMTESLAAAGNDTALALALEQSPEALMNSLGGQLQQTEAAPVQQAQSQAPVAVLPQEMMGTTPAQAEFARVAEAVNGAGENAPQPSSQPAGDTQVVLVEASSANAQGEPELAQLLETGKAQGSFESAVRAVKAQMAETEGAGAAKELDVDELQKQVDATDLTAKAQTADIGRTATEVRATPQPVEAQLEQAITKGIADGSEQIVMKLNPAELGEVTIQMQRTEAGGFILTIIAKNPETQRMLASEMAQLQENLRPMKVEVASITTDSKYQMADAQQQFGGQHQRTWQEMHGAGYYGDEKLAAAAEQAPPQLVQKAPKSALDAYI